MNREYIRDNMNRIMAGDHLVLLYDEVNNEENVYEVASYIISRINKKEKCYYIAGDIDTNFLKKELSNFIDLEKYLNSGQLSILEKEDAYSKDGKFDPNKMIELIKSLTDEALVQGYNAFALTGELSWVLEYDDGFEMIMHYEYLLNKEIFTNYPVSAICRYNINKFSSLMIKNIIEVHPIIIYKGEIHENPFYFDVISIDNLDIDEYQVKSMLSAIQKYSLDRSRFIDELKNKEEKYHELQLSVLKNMVVTLTGLLEIHDEYTRDHSQNVANYSKLIAQAMNLSLSDISKIYYSGLVHDIGKAIIPKEILNKNGKLTDEEYTIVKKHPTYAYQALVQNNELSEISKIVLQHHERWDGYGYPNGLKEQEITIEARIIAIADSFDAMTSNRPYRKAFSKEQAINEIFDKLGSQFDPTIGKIAIEKVFKYI